MNSQLQVLDIGVISLYFLAVFSIALFFYFRRNKSNNGQSEDYFLGGKNLAWWAIGASLFASNIGSEHLIGLAGAGAKGDFPAAQFEILASLILLLLGWVFVPFYMKSGVYTMPEFLEKRYNSWARSYLTWVSIVAYVITKISVTIAAGGIVFTALLGINFWTGAILIVLITGVYTILGGLKVVVYTDFLQMLVLLGGSIAITLYGLGELGGWGELVSKTESSYLSLWRSADDTSFPWTGVLLGAPILGVWYWCTDQFIVQRVLSAKNIDEGRKGTIFGAFLKLLPLFLFVIPGVIAFVLSNGPDAKIHFPMENGVINYDAALPILTMQLLPAGLKGLVIAGLLAALMSSLSSVFNSCSTLITMDLYKKWRPQTDDKALVRFGQKSTAFLVLLGLAWIPLMNLIEGGLFQKLQSIQAYISPPIAAVFLVGIFNKKITSKAAKYALLTGAFVGTARLILELIKENLSGFLYDFAQINFLHFAFLLFLICVAILFLFSTKKEAVGKELSEITYSKGHFIWKENFTNLILSALVILGVISLWIVFV